MDVAQCPITEANRENPEGEPTRQSLVFRGSAVMHLQIKHMVRLSLRAQVQRSGIIGGKPWSVSTTRQRGANTSADVQTLFASQSCRNYASDTTYSRAFATARDKPGDFWAEVGHDVHWFEPWRKTLHVEDPVFPNWYVFKVPWTLNSWKGC